MSNLEIECMKGRLADEIGRANDRQCQAVTEGDREAEQAWHGYVKALRWVDRVLLAGPELHAGPCDCTDGDLERRLDRIAPGWNKWR